MTLTEISLPNNDPYADATAHFLLVAEHGFSMLDIYARDRNGITINALHLFADQVNARNEAGSLHPKAPISGIPRKFLRELADHITPATIDELKKQILDFLEANRNSIHAKKIVIDLRVSPKPVPELYLQACRELLADPMVSRGVDNVVLINGSTPVNQDNPYGTYQKWLTDTWSIKNLESIVETRGKNNGKKLYTVEAVSKLADRYGALDNYTDSVGLSLRSSLSTVLQPYLPPQPTKIGIYFRDWPVPCCDRKTGLAPEECGGAVVPTHIMSDSIGHLFQRESLYVTLSRGLRAAHEIAKKQSQVGDFPTFVRNSVVGDLVKIQALFKNVDGALFDGALSKRSCHTWGMYEFAGRLFAQEIEQLQLTIVIGFGSEYVWQSALESMKKDWCIHIAKKNVVVGAQGSNKTFYLLPHPMAFGDALQKAIRSIAGMEVDLIPLSTDNLVDDLDLDANSKCPNESYFTFIEDWLEQFFGGWDDEPHHANGNGMRTFKPEGRKRGAIYGKPTKSAKGRTLVFRCNNREKWLAPNALPGIRIKAGKDDRVHVYIPDGTDLSALAPLIMDWK
jgi:hypothetical protein